jgi:cyanate permease
VGLYAVALAITSLGMIWVAERDHRREIAILAVAMAVIGIIGLAMLDDRTSTVVVELGGTE